MSSEFNFISFTVKYDEYQSYTTNDYYPTVRLRTSESGWKLGVIVHKWETSDPKGYFLAILHISEEHNIDAAYWKNPKVDIDIKSTINEFVPREIEQGYTYSGKLSILKFSVNTWRFAEKKKTKWAYTDKKTTDTIIERLMYN